MQDRRTTQERLLGRRGLRSLTKLMPDFTDLDLGISADDIVAELRHAPVVEATHRVAR